MKAIICTKYGSPDVLKLQDVAKPAPKDDEVLIRIHATSINGNLLPVTHGLQAVRTIIDGASYASVLPLIGAEILIGLIYGAIAWLMFGYRLRVTRQRGSFELV